MDTLYGKLAGWLRHLWVLAVDPQTLTIAQAIEELRWHGRRWAAYEAAIGLPCHHHENPVAATTQGENLVFLYGHAKKRRTP